MSLVLYVDRPWISPYVFSAYVALKEKNVPFDVVALDLSRGEQRTDAYQRGSLTGRVPAIRHEDFWLSESQAIVEYVDEVFPGAPLLPSSPRDRARARQMMAWVRSDLMPIREERSTHTMFFDRSSKPLSEAGQAAAARLLRVAESLVPPGRTTMFDRWCVADADLSFVLHRLILNGHPVPAPVLAYARANWERESVRSFVERAREPE